jgi:hypothetical protein
MMLVASTRLVFAAEGGAVSTGMTATHSAVEPQRSPISNAELLRKAQEANEDLYASLRSFVCDESIWRTRENLKGRKTRNLDTLTTRVSFENGQESYSEVHQNSLSRPDLSSAGGAWSEGEFGTLLRQTQQLLRTEQVVFEGSGERSGTPVAFVSFAVSRDDSPWVLVVDGRSYKIPFRTEIAIEAATGHILSVKRDATEIPPSLYISEIQWSVDMRPTTLAGSSWLLPAEGEYAVSYTDGSQRDRNRMTFGNYRRYGSEVALRFDPVN